MSKTFKKKSKIAAVTAVLFAMVLSVGVGVIGAYGICFYSRQWYNELNRQE